MSDIDDVTAAADAVASKLPHDLPVESGWGTVRDRLDGATTALLLELARGGIGEPEACAKNRTSA